MSTYRLVIALLALVIVGSALSYLADMSGARGGTFLEDKAAAVATANLASFDAVAEQKEWRERLHANGPEQTRDEFQAVFAPVENYAVQHTAAHLIGELYYQELGLDGMKFCDDTSNFGCYHGFMSSAGAESGDIASVFPKIEQGCLALPTRSVRSNCFHGLGHGVLGNIGYDIPSLKEGLRICQSSVHSVMRERCYAGAFMEFNARFLLHAPNIYANDPRPLGEDPYEPCNDVDAEFKPTCFFWISDWWKGVFDRDFGKIDALCGAIPSENHREECYKGMGKAIVWFSPRTVERNKKLCAVIKDETYERMCLAEAAQTTFARTGDAPLAGSLCENVEDVHKAECLAPLEEFQR